MTTAMRLLPVRVSPALRGLIDQVGPVNPATRALLVLGAAAAGLELRGLEREVAALLSAELDSHTQDALRRLFAQLPSTAHHPRKTMPLGTAAEPADEVTPPEDVPDDPFANIGIDV